MRSLLFNHLTGALSQYEPAQLLAERMRGRDFPIDVDGPQGGFLALMIAWLGEQTDGPALVLAPTEQEARAVSQDLSLAGEAEVELFPWWNTLPYGEGRPLPSVFGERVRTLTRLLSGEPLVLVCPLKAFLVPLPPPEYLAAQILHLRRGEEVDPQGLALRLQALGYLRVPRVGLHGEFALRGEVLDLFPFGAPAAYRVVLDMDRIAEIRLFEVATQASVGKVEQASVPPVREVLFDEPRLQAVGRALEMAGNDGAVEETLEHLARDPEQAGAEFLFPLAFEQPASLLDYLGEGWTLFQSDAERLAAGSAALRKEYLELYRRARSPGRCLPAPRQLLFDLARLSGGGAREVRFHSVKGAAGEAPRVTIRSEPPRSFFGNISFFREEMENLIAVGYRVFLFAEYAHQAERLRHILKDLSVEIFPEGISGGFSLPQFKTVVIEENEVFGRKRRIPRSIATAASRPIDSFVELGPGDYVVHVSYGVGLFHGLERIRAAGHERDYIHLEYAEGEKIYVPVEQVNLVQRYIGQEGRKPALDRIGGRGWESKKARVKRSVEEMARRLVSLYSRRREAKGFAFPPDTDWQSEFEAAFPYQETEDQLRAIEEVKMDMESSRPMDRLVCGDVGYGKTEVALRAAFKAVTGGKQVAYLAPTTILVEQHFETFRDRFSRYPVRVEMLSRFLSGAEQRQVIRGLQRGEVDIVIGTHRLLQNDVRFRNLGLMIVDEEQRFGVKDKERLKEIKTSVDCLTLTATPIPRTLHMSLMKIRDMSIINTPPPNRYPIETFIQEFDEEVVVRAVREEVGRGGQVYFLHNRIQTMPRIQSLLWRLLPGVQVATAHGQMEEEELEEVMHRFVRGNTQVLLSTTIIENGLDIPNVNTIIIDRADTFGISQLYQLRGRVGRADQPAYAYLLYPRQRVISELAMKRLKIISDFTDLGSGFKIALKDLEIRGAGNLLGAEQSGDILAVGLDMYLRLLDEAISELGEEKREEPPEVTLELEYTGYIPDGYVAEPMEKMEMYKKIVSATDRDELAAAQREMEDRFGSPPDAVYSLFSVAEIRILCRRLFVSSLKEHAGTVTVEFSRLANVSVDRVLTVIREGGGNVSLDPGRPQCLLIRTRGLDMRHKPEFVAELLTRLL